MCDTFAVGGEYTSRGSRIFAKNSDREPDEAHIVVSVPARQYPASRDLRCTYISIPQARSTRAVLLCKPFWIWGAEMGVNERGVVIGNEALFTKLKPEKFPGLIGMDLVRLGLERADTAREAAAVIVSMLKLHGQGGACGHRDKKFAYMNSFLIMDRTEILVLETVGRDYALKLHHGFAAISNCITLGRDWKMSSLPWGTDFRKFSDPVMTFFSGSRERRRQVRDGITSVGKSFGVENAFGILRGHRDGKPFRGLNHDVCMHAADPVFRRSHTTGSLVVELDSSNGFRVFVTAGSSPCLTMFKPVLPSGMPAGIGHGSMSYSDDSYWWRHEMFRIQAELRLSQVQPAILREVCELEEHYCEGLPFYPWESTDERLVNLSQEAFFRASTLEASWLGHMRSMAVDRGPMHNAFWRSRARRSGVPLD
ncbi:MAG: peptidase family C69 [Desulfomonilia bacterium]|jgi:secernin